MSPYDSDQATVISPVVGSTMSVVAWFCSALADARRRPTDCSRRYLSPFMVRMLTWWVSLSSRAPVSRSDPRTDVQSSKGRFEVMTVEPRS